MTVYVMESPIIWILIQVYSNSVVDNAQKEHLSFDNIWIKKMSIQEKVHKSMTWHQ